jgi:hypothetical protein
MHSRYEDLYWLVTLAAILSGALSFFTPWLYFVETGTPTFQGMWGFGPIYYSESPVRENPQTIAGVSLGHSLTSAGTSYLIWHELSLWLMIGAALATIVSMTLVGRRARRPGLGVYVASIAPSALATLSIIAWVQFTLAGVSNACFDTTCLSGLSGQWIDPNGPAAMKWGLGSGFFLAVATAIALGLAGSAAILNKRSSQSNHKSAGPT